MIRLCRRVGEVSIGHTLIQLEEYVFDLALYPYMLYSGGESFLRITAIAEASSENGFWAGFAIMFACSVVFNYLYVRAYDRLKVDWFGIEAIRSFHPSWAQKLPPVLRTTISCGTFAGLAIWANPLFAVLWLRSPAARYEMTRSDWGVFAIAIILANIGWTFLIASAVWLFAILAI